MVNVAQNNERLGPAERIIQTLLAYSDHMVHNRPGMVVRDGNSVTGVRWTPVTHKEEGDPKQKVVYILQQMKVGKKTRTHRARVGVLQANGDIVENGRVVGRYQPAGLFEEVAVWMYRQVAEVWKLDNEFAAKWASYAFGQEHRDLKVTLAAFMLVQSRKGDPIKDNGKVAFHDADFRDVGEAMLLLHQGKTAMNPKLVLRVYELLSLPAIAAINRELGFGRSTKRPFYGRWPKTAERWVGFREDNPKMLEGLVKAGFRTTVQALAQHAAHVGGGYKPTSPRFYQILRWKQAQAKDGHRALAIGEAVAAAETWDGLDEAQVCERIVKTKPNWKRIVGLLPQNVGVTRAVVAAAIEAGSMSDKDLVIATPTLEELGLLEVQDVKERWTRAVKAAEDMRAANIARNVKSKETKEVLEQAADTALQKAVEEVLKDLRVYFVVDISGSMAAAIEAAKAHLARFVQGFPMDKLHVSVFNTSGREIKIPHNSAAGVDNAFRGIAAGGGTNYASGVRALAHLRPKPEEDSLFIFVGDEQNGGGHTFEEEFRRSGITPVAFGFVRIIGTDGMHQRAVQDTAARLGVPCFMIDERTFADPYAIPRTIRALVAATPVGVRPQAAPPPQRVTLVDTILKTELLKKPAWALPEAQA